jgi:2-phospho-L-lactate guanylyltransferase
VQAGIDRVLLVPGDCPALDGDQLSALLAQPVIGPRTVVIVPDRHGTGTNALLLAPPDVITPAFGPGSFERHRDLAAETRAVCEIVRASTLMLDIDTPEDLAALLAGGADGAPRTRAVLAVALAGR